jgi:hypothetical protein
MTEIASSLSFFNMSRVSALGKTFSETHVSSALTAPKTKEALVLNRVQRVGKTLQKDRVNEGT